MANKIIAQLEAEQLKQDMPEFSPGDTVVVSGVKGSDGKIAATSVSDSGAGATGLGAVSGSRSSGSSGSSSSAVGSLFGGGGSK